MLGTGKKARFRVTRSPSWAAANAVSAAAHAMLLGHGRTCRRVEVKVRGAIVGGYGRAARRRHGLQVPALLAGAGPYALTPEPAAAACRLVIQDLLQRA